MKIDVAIIGAGHNGLVAATYLARAGLNVHVFEREDKIGGATRNEELWPGYIFSTCAHLLHVFPARLVRELGLRERGLQVVHRDEVILLKRDGTYHSNLDFNLPNNLTAAAKLSAEERAGWDRYVAFKQIIARLVRPHLMSLPPTLEELTARAAGTPAEEALRLATSMSLWEVHDHFLPTDRLRERAALDLSAVSCNPSAMALTYTALGQPDPETGEANPWGFVKGGMGRLAAMIADAAIEAGATIHTDTPVQEILVEQNRITGLQLANGQTIQTPCVLSCADPKTTFLKLLSPAAMPPGLRERVESINTSVGCFKLVAAVSELPQWKGWDGDPDLPHRGSVQLEMNRDAIRTNYAELKAGIPPSRPMMSVNVPSMLDDTIAPPGKHTVSIYVYSAAAKLAKGTWDDHRVSSAESLIDQITEYAPNFRRSIINYEFRTPLDLERKVALTDGSIWHAHHDAHHLLANRPLPELSHYRAPISGLYLGGAGQHGGGEVSGIPGHNSAHEILNDLQNS
uniref:phytoene desaturase family protein n=1 Tax=Cephaloticoccus sp. TaxID=1985742 RepID=UPI004049854E